MSDLQTKTELISPQESIESVKENIRDYIAHDPEKRLYPDLTPQECRRYQNGTLEQREALDKFNNHNPYKLEKFTGLIATATTLLAGKAGQENLLAALDYLATDLHKGLEAGESISQTQVEALQDLLKQTLGAVG
jgi:hypothetical protein